MLHRSLRIKSVRPGELVRWDDRHYVTLACRSGVTTLRDVTTFERVDVDMASLVEDDNFEVLGTCGPDSMSDAAETIVLLQLTDAQRKDVLWWRDHLNEVIFQVVHPADPGARPREGYESDSITERRQKKVQELQAAGHQVSVRTLIRKQSAYEKHGLLGLLDQRTQRIGQGVPQVDPRLEQAVIDILSETTHQSTVTREVHITRVRDLVARRHASDENPVEIPSGRTIRRLLDAHDHRKLSTGKATTRRTEANRPDRDFMPLIVGRPGEIVEADSTPVNAQLLMPDGKTLDRPTLTVLVDRCTRSVLSWAFHEGATSGYDIAYLIARALRPMRYWNDAPEQVRLLSAQALPGLAMTALDPDQRKALALPYIVPETITTDQGRDYLSANVLRVCAHFGISVIQAPPQSPDHKGVVERTLGSAETMWMQYLDHYVGNSVQNRGREMRGEVMTLAEMERSFAEWVVRVWQNRPHPKLRVRELPGRLFSPNQMYAAHFDSSPGVPVPIDADTFIELLPVTTRTVQSDGINFRNEVYDTPALNGLRKTRHPATRDGKWIVSYDPYDPERIWVRHPETGDFIECTARSVRLTTLPLGDNTLARLHVLPAADGNVQTEWALDQLAANEERRVRAKKQRQDKRTLAAVEKPRSQRKAEGMRARRDADDAIKVPEAAPLPMPAPATPKHIGVEDYTVSADVECI